MSEGLSLGSLTRCPCGRQSVFEEVHDCLALHAHRDCCLKYLQCCGSSRGLHRAHRRPSLHPGRTFLAVTYIKCVLPALLRATGLEVNRL